MPRRWHPTAGVPLIALALVAGTAGTAPEVGAQDPATGPVPVVLVPGWGDLATGVLPLQERLIEAGWREGEIFALSFEDPWGSNQEHAREVEGAVHALLQRTDSERVDLVAHSMGGLAVREFLAGRGAAEVIRRTVFLGTPHRGTLAAILAWGDGGREMAPGSGFLARLNAREPPEEVQMLSVRSAVDLRVIPGSSAMLPGAYNVEICCPSHVGMMDDDQTFEEVLGFLLHGPDELTAPDGTIPLRTEPGWWRQPPWDR